MYFEIFGYDWWRCAYLFGNFVSDSHFMLILPSRVQVTTLRWLFGFTLVNIFKFRLLWQVVRIRGDRLYLGIVLYIAMLGPRIGEDMRIIIIIIIVIYCTVQRSLAARVDRLQERRQEHLTMASRQNFTKYVVVNYTKMSE